MDNYRALDAHRFFSAGWVGLIEHLRTPTGDVLIDIKLSHSRRLLRPLTPLNTGESDAGASMD